MKPAPFTYHRAVDLEHALDLLAAYGPEGGRILAGGQSLVPLMALRLAQPPHLIDINRVAFGALRTEEGAFCIPAVARHGALANAAPPRLGNVLAQVAGHIAHMPIRSRGTFCGSVAHADPAAEWPLVFITLGGEAVVRSKAAERRLAAPDVVLDIMTTALAADEILTEIRLAIPDPAVRLGFHEISRRAGDYAMAMAFVAFSVQDGLMVAPRVGVGGAERRPRRMAAAEAALEGRAPERGACGRAAAAAAASIDPMEDSQVDGALRRNLVRAAVARALQSAAG